MVKLMEDIQKNHYFIKKNKLFINYLFFYVRDWK